jgi:hypothetical protein
VPDYTDVNPQRADQRINRDRWGRPLLPDPETGEERAWTRVTTVAGNLKDRYGLEDWGKEGVAFGIGHRPDLYLLAAACRREDKDTLGEIVEQAEATAAQASAANVGSAIHQFTERIDRGEEIHIPPPFDHDVAAYYKALELAGITVAVGWIERLVCIPGPGFGDVAGMAGTPDRIYNSMWPLPRIGDLKTASDGRRKDGTLYNKILEYGMVDIPLQLAIYSHATHWWDGTQWVAMPKVDQQTAVVAHIPAGQGECRLYEIDIAAGWEAVQLALDVDAWHRRKDLATIIPLFESGPVGAGAGSGNGAVESEGDPPLPPTPAAGEPWDLSELRSRVEAIKAHSDQAKQWLAARWPVAVPTFPKGGPRDEAEITRVTEAIAKTEEQFKIAPASAAGEDGRQPGDEGAGKGGEVGTPSADDPPAPTSSPLPEPEAFSVRKTWAAERIEAIKAPWHGHDIEQETPRKMLARLWPEGVATFPKGGPVNATELDRVLGVCELVEMQFSMSFTTDPTAPPPEPGSLRKNKR